MHIPQEIMDYCEARYKWDDDLRQELYVKMLEAPEDTTINKAWCVTVHNNLLHDRHRVESGRKRLLEENYEAIVRNLGLTGSSPDPHDITVGQEQIVKHLDSLSAVLATTLFQYYVEGRSPEDIATTGNENVEAVRKRITRARNQLKGE